MWKFKGVPLCLAMVHMNELQKEMAKWPCVLNLGISSIIFIEILVYWGILCTSTYFYNEYKGIYRWQTVNFGVLGRHHVAVMLPLEMSSSA